ncbi:hypothetical protein OV203_12560 [Nannocystis sp. ILAH1]|uniref:hypothetical protein n=1 Tax=unclassified Nannocystis TaxID=2627009 RepID=UPI00226F7BA0|nr:MULTISPECIES: hypothetical protein [unclassified Nannocystis]MCY0987962.1 hypothetical protein [Nannocystis sp. ILAH1]MCY1065695.1 hypothetical protein [Nannocystis sp. RBIL2]
MHSCWVFKDMLAEAGSSSEGYNGGLEPLSPGVFSIMKKQLELCRAWGLRYLYLGLYIRECPSMA